MHPRCAEHYFQCIHVINNMQAKENSPFCCNYRAMFNKIVSVMSASASENLDFGRQENGSHHILHHYVSSMNH